MFERYRGLLILLLWVCALFSLVSLTLVLIHADGAAHTSDFPVFHAAANAWVSGKLSLAQLYDLELLEEHMRLLYGEKAVLFDSPWIYPPPMILAVAPLGLLPIVEAYVVWVFVTLFCAAASAWLLGARGVVLLALTLNPLTIQALHWGQTSMLPLLFFALGLSLLDRRPILAGFLFGLMAIKPQMAFAAPLLLLYRKEYRAMAGYACCGFLLLAASLASGAFTVFLDAAGGYLDFIQEAYGTDIFNASVYGRAWALGWGDPAALTVHFACLGGALILCRRYPYLPLITLAGLMVPIYTLTHSLVLFLPSIALGLMQILRVQDSGKRD